MKKSDTSFPRKNPWYRKMKGAFFWYPIHPFGWIIDILYLFVVYRLFIDIDSKSHSGSDTLINFVPAFLFVTFLLFLLFYIMQEKGPKIENI